jgi:hypothetical protein
MSMRDCGSGALRPFDGNLLRVMQCESRMVPAASRPSQVEVSDEVTDGVDVVGQVLRTKRMRL